MKLSEVALKLGCRLEGPPELEIRGVAGIEHAEAGQITFLANRRYFPLLKTTRASAVLVEEGITLEREASLPELAALRSGNPYLAFAQAIELFYQSPRYASGIHPTAVIAKSARIGEGAHVGPYCYIDEDVEIGCNPVLHSFVTIYRGAKIGDDFFSHAHAVVREFCRLGNRVILQNGVVIGGDGFGFAKQRDGTWHKMLQAGPSGKPASHAAPKSTTLSSLAMAHALAPTPCFAAKWGSPDRRRWAAIAFLPGKSGREDTSPSGIAR
jgi:UDP-3-O-[3-hydroxymyristoyl] glucosamine N-acyltransferase